jgi:predicted glycoside hydrolase/deacetylase ChbG (UPF0249 family)
VDANDEVLKLREQMHDMAGKVQAVMSRDAVVALQMETLLEMFKEHKDESREFMSETRTALSDIRQQTTRTNGRVTALEMLTSRQASQVRAESDSKPITRRDVNVAVGVGVLCVGVVVWMFIEFGPYVQAHP